jgi:hypothetical protein
VVFKKSMIIVFEDLDKTLRIINWDLWHYIGVCGTASEVCGTALLFAGRLGPALVAGILVLYMFATKNKFEK